MIIGKSGKSTCPVTLFLSYLRRTGLSAPRDSDLFVFRAINGRGPKAKLCSTNKPLSYSRAREVFRESVKKMGYDPTRYVHHSFRIGGTTAAANAGVDHKLLKSHG